MKKIHPKGWIFLCEDQKVVACQHTFALGIGRFRYYAYTGYSNTLKTSPSL